MNRLIYLSSASLVVHVIFTLAGCLQSKPLLEGHWAVVRVVDSAPISAMGPDDEQAHVGQTFLFKPNEWAFEDMVCNEPTAHSTPTLPQTFFDEYRIEPEQDWLKGSRVVEFKCQRGDFVSPVLLKDGRFLFVLDGVLFEAKQIEPHSP
ncbi:hypothetical protein NQT62_00965 [Limnobacter humi]|uniref:Lipoprotein n=1 Tax=Limnobacter humi TaxID=1778671 RepID=A0ABT1WBW3_9BURK|nr:hypothetical protein [Limnobacter humi]MCQ8895005.1 hypothetical protein [Limnobacter humi]